MHQAFGMDRGNRPGDHLQQPGGIPGGIRGVEAVLERSSRDVRKDEIEPWAGCAGLVQRYDIGMSDACIGPRLAQPASALARARARAAPDDLQRHMALQAGLPGLVDHAHGPTAQLAPDLETRYVGPLLGVGQGVR